MGIIVYFCSNCSFQMAGFGIPRRLPVEDIPEIVLSDSSDKSDGDLPVPSESSNDKKPIQSESSKSTVGMFACLL